MVFLALVFGLVVVAQLRLPFRLAGIALALGAIALGVRLLILVGRRRRAGLGAGGWPVVAAGLALTGVLLMVLVAEAAYYPVVVDQERCSAAANTRIAQAACDRATRHRLDNLVDRLNGDSTHP